MSSNLPLSFWFVLGHEPLLSAAEIFSTLNLSSKTGDFVYAPPLLKLTSAVNPRELINLLGGTIKIAEELAANLNEDELMSVLLKELRTIDGKIVFGMSWYDTEQPAANNDQSTQRLSELGKRIKKTLTKEGRSARYIVGDEPTLSSVTVSKNRLATRGREFLISAAGGKFALAKTVAVQPFEAFSARDYGRPGRDDTSGMLPPKLAIMLINLTRLPRKALLLDPFCGSGTILTEALLLGYHHLVGADISDKAVHDAEQNIQWTRTQLPSPENEFRTSALQSDVRDLAKKLSLHSVDGIATEPYLGPPLTGRETPEQIQKNSTELFDLYLGAFREFKKILKPGGTVVIVIPRFRARGKWLTISDRLVPQLEKIGFKKERLLPTTLSQENFLLYHRPGQFVGREIWKFTL